MIKQHHTLSFSFSPPVLIFSLPVANLVDNFSFPLASFSRMFGMVPMILGMFLRDISGIGSITHSTPHLKIFRRFLECKTIELSETRMLVRDLVIFVHQKLAFLVFFKLAPW